MYIMFPISNNAMHLFLIKVMAKISFGLLLVSNKQINEINALTCVTITLLHSQYTNLHPTPLTIH